jgi:HlyD family secretion protein
MRRFIVIFFLVAVAVAAVVVANLRRDPSRFGVDWRIKKNLPTKEVRVEQPRRATIVQTVTAPGTIELIEEADIASQIVGKVQAVCVQKGDLVRQGDLLVKLDDEDARARLASTEARIERLKAAIELAEADLEKARVDSAGYRKLAERGYSSPNEVRDGETILAKMMAALDMSQQELKETFAIHRNSQQEVERTEIRSPMDGTVIHLDVEKGEVVIAGTTNLPGTVLMTIGDMSRMRVRADVYESDVGLLRPLQPARIYLQADQAVPLPGAVDLISPKGTRLGAVVSFETLINLDGQHESVRPEMTATVEIEVNRADDVLSLPVQAVVYRRYRDLPQTALFRDWLASQPVTPAEKGKDLAIRYVKVVFVMEDGIAHARPVATGISDQDRIEIRDGLKPEDTVIVGPFRALDEMEDGQPVKLEEVRPEANDSEKSEAKPPSPPDQTPEAATASDDETGDGP